MSSLGQRICNSPSFPFTEFKTFSGENIKIRRKKLYQRGVRQLGRTFEDSKFQK